MRRLADGGVVHAEVAADGRTTTSPELTPDADLHLCHPCVRQSPPRSGRIRLLHPERRIARPHGVVLVGDRRPEERHDPVAHDLVHGALVAMDGLHHPLEDGVEELPGLLGVAVGEQLHRALEVGEENGHLLALALECGLRGENPFGQVFRCVNLWRGEPRLGVMANGERRGALSAELVARRIGRATGRTDRRKRSGTLAAELHASGILSVAPGTAHQSNAFVACSAFSRENPTYRTRFLGQSPDEV